MLISYKNVSACYIYIFIGIGFLGMINAAMSSGSSGRSSFSSSGGSRSSFSAGGGGGIRGNSLTMGGGLPTGSSGADMTGDGGKSTDPTNSENNKIKAQTMGMVNSAVNQLQGGQAGTEGKKIVGTGPNGETLVCEPRVLEGSATPEALKEEHRKKCLEQAQHKKQMAEEIVKKSKPDECNVKISKQSMICHTKKVIKNMVEQPYWGMDVFGNVVQMKKNGEVIAMAVVETLNYDITKQEVEKHENLKKPNVQVEFNELGGLLSQKGELPAAKPDDPCAECLSNLNKKANSMEGSQDDCAMNCESHALMDLLKPAHFREIEGSSKPPQDQTKPSPEEKPEGEPETTDEAP